MFFGNVIRMVACQLFQSILGGINSLAVHDLLPDITESVSGLTHDDGVLSTFIAHSMLTYVAVGKRIDSRI